MKKILPLIFAVALFASCSVEKRHYQSGYHISWKGSHKKSSAVKVALSDENESPQTAATLANKDNDFLLESDFKRQTIFDSIPKKVDCDSIFFRTGGDKIAARVIEINANEVKYKKCSNPDGPLFVVKRSDVAKIRYANGVEEVITLPPPVREQKATKNRPAKQPRSGKPQNPRDDNAYPQQRKLFVPALLSMIFGIASEMSVASSGSNNGTGAAFSFIMLSLGALIMGIISLSKIRRNPDEFKGKGMAMTGLIIGAINLAILLLVIFIVLLMGI